MLKRKNQVFKPKKCRNSKKRRNSDGLIENTKNLFILFTKPAK